MRIKKIFTLLIISFTFLFAQKITVVDNSTNSPIPDVVVNSENISRVTNKYGVVDISAFKKTEVILFSHLSYKMISVKKYELISKKIVELTPKTFFEDEVVITDMSLVGDKSQFRKTIELSSKEIQSFNNVGDILKLKSSLQLKDYGGYGATKTVSSRGMSSENTVVLFNNVKVSDLRSGIFDFSKISSHSIDKIEVLKNADSESSHIAAGGIVKITSGNTNKNSLRFLTKIGSDGLKSFTGSFNKATKNYSYGIKAEYGESKNQYDFEYLDKKYKRKNAQLKKGFFCADYSLKKNNFVLKIYSHYSHFKNGIPGFVVTNNVASSKATNETNSSLSIINFDYLITEEFTFNSTLSYHNQVSIYEDPENQMFYQEKKKESKMNNITSLNRFIYKFYNYNISTGYEFNYADISGMNYIEQLNKPITNFRNNHKLFGSISGTFHDILGLLKTTSLSAHFTYDYIDEKLGYEKHTEGRSFNFSIAARINGIENFILKSHLFDSFRNPTLNERYFSSLFFPSELNAEKYKGFDVGFNYEFNLIGKTNVSLSYFNIDGQDKIIWIPGRMGIHKPMNYGKVQTTGFEIDFNKSLFNKFLEIDVIYNITEARNKNYFGQGDNSYNKYLVYSPLHRLNVNTSIKYSDFQFSVYTHFESERYYTTDNTLRNRLKHFFVTDVSILYNFKFLSKNNSITLKIHNLLNENYFVVQSYPMPLRNFLITYNLEILWKNYGCCLV